MLLPADHSARMERALLALDGLSVGDAFGQRFFYAPNVESLIDERAMPAPPWPYTDDTEMALGLVGVLDGQGHVDADDLARTFGRRYRANPNRGYGGTAHGILEALADGGDWRSIAGRVFGGQGSMGNGAAMRVAPLGAYFADDLDKVVEQARLSAAVTHAHPDGQAGAVAIAVASALAWQFRHQRARGCEWLEAVWELVPEGDTRRGIHQALQIPADLSAQTAANLLGSGYGVISSDTVPFSLWCAARHLDDYTEALWATVSGLGDRDTTCAIVGGIVALAVGRTAIPADWLSAREPLALEGGPG
jgi:ADP-ribosylglycohydrolase